MAAPPLAEVVDLIKTQSASAPSLQQLLTALQQREDQIIQQLPEVDGAIDALDPALHTLGLVFILNCKAAAVPLSAVPLSAVPLWASYPWTCRWDALSSLLRAHAPMRSARRRGASTSSTRGGMHTRTWRLTPSARSPRAVGGSCA